MFITYVLYHEFTSFNHLEVVKDPINTIKRIYEHFDMKLAFEAIF